jgi:hypothetical protein
LTFTSDLMKFLIAIGTVCSILCLVNTCHSHLDLFFPIKILGKVSKMLNNSSSLVKYKLTFPFGVNCIAHFGCFLLN